MLTRRDHKQTDRITSPVILAVVITRFISHLNQNVFLFKKKEPNSENSQNVPKKTGGQTETVEAGT